ncbi:hypothetical protein BT93_E0661 [Corymbia citriodora subsp. variegata]|nr:hypothetical protein BT93_E0661 [Corymbia citriodora subsp. variegata]
MASSSMSLFFVLVLRVIASRTASAEACPIRRCSLSGPEVRFPFRIRDIQDEQCGYKGFEVSCDDRERTILSLSEAGYFVLDAIDYANQTVLVKDPDGCLPKRLLKADLVSSYSPFPAPVYENFMIGNCSSAVYSSMIPPESGVEVVDCLSLGHRMVVASVAEDDLARSWMLNQGCRTWTALIPWWWQPPTNLSGSIRLRWDQPNCKLCEEADERCMLKNFKTGPKIVCVPKHGFSTGAQLAIASLFMLPWLVCIFGFIWFLEVRVFIRRGLDQISSNRTPGSAPPNGVNGEAVEVTRRDAVGAMGIDSVTIESYPKTQIDDLGQLPRPNDDVCTICLSKYERDEMIRTIPECKHYFHAYCIDLWLRKNASCPLCRNNKG